MEARIYCPLAAPEDAFVRAKLALINSFGGVTITRGVGCWKDGAGKIIEEPVRVMSAFTFDDDEQRVRWTMDSIGRSYLKESGEDAVLYVVGGRERMLDRKLEEAKVA